MTSDLKAACEAAEAKAHKLQAAKDQALQAVRDKYDQDLRDAVDAAAAAQQQWRDALALEGLEGREDAAQIAERLGLSE